MWHFNQYDKYSIVDLVHPGLVSTQVLLDHLFHLGPVWIAAVCVVSPNDDPIKQYILFGFEMPHAFIKVICFLLQKLQIKKKSIQILHNPSNFL